MEAADVCEKASDDLVDMMPPHTPIWDIQWTTCEPRCADFGGIYNFFNDPENRRQLNAAGDFTWEMGSGPVGGALRPDRVKSQIHNVESLLENGVKVLVYNGANDYICNWVGGKAWTQAVEWTHKDSFGKKAFEEWTGTEGEVGGLIQNYENFTFLIFNGAGHMVQERQPANGIKMMHDFMEYGASLTPKSEEKFLKE